MLKCYLVSQKIEPPKTHDMRQLCELCIEIESKFDEIYTEAVLLTRYAVRLRYPTELGLIEQDAEKAVKNADEIMDFVKILLPKTVHE